MSNNYHYLFKYVVAGEIAVGKSTIIQQFTEETSRNSYIPSQKIHFASKNIEINDLTVKCQVWDSVLTHQNQQKNDGSKKLGDSLYKKAAAILLLFDLTNRQSFQSIQKWIRDIHSSCGQSVIIGVIGNKVDLVDQRAISKQQCQQLSSFYKVFYAESCSYDNQSVNQVFWQISKIVLEKMSNQQLKLESSGIKRGKKQMQSPSVSLSTSNTWESAENKWKKEQTINDSDKICSAVEEMMICMRKTKLIEDILTEIKANIKQKGVHYITQLKDQYSNLLVSRQSNVIQNLFEVFDVIQIEITNHQLNEEKLSMQNSQLQRYQQNIMEMNQYKQNCEKLQKKIELLNLQKTKLQQYKQNSQKRQRELMNMIETIKRERKQIMDRFQKQRIQLNNLQNKNMELTRQISDYKQFQSEVKLKEMIYQKQNCQFMEDLEVLGEQGVKSEIVDKLKRKFTHNASMISQICRISSSS